MSTFTQNFYNPDVKFPITTVRNFAKSLLDPYRTCKKCNHWYTIRLSINHPIGKTKGIDRIPYRHIHCLNENNTFIEFCLP